MEYLWLAVLVAIILRFIGRQPVGRQSRRYRPRGRPDVPRESLPGNERKSTYNEKEMPYARESEMPYSGRELPPLIQPAGEQGEKERGADIPQGHVGRGSILTNAGAESAYTGMLQGQAVARLSSHGKDTISRREPHANHSDHGLFADSLDGREITKGIVWAQILGPRGGIQANRGFRYR